MLKAKQNSALNSARLRSVFCERLGVAPGLSFVYSGVASMMEVPMKLNVYVLFDSKVQAYMQPFYMRADGEAVRAVLQASRDPNVNFHQYPADFTLFRIGEYDDGSGRHKTLDAFENLGNLLTLRSAEAGAVVNEAAKEA